MGSGSRAVGRWGRSAAVNDNPIDKRMSDDNYLLISQEGCDAALVSPSRYTQMAQGYKWAIDGIP